MELLRDIRDCKVDSVKEKINNSANWEQMVRIVDGEGMNPLHHACKKGFSNISKLIISNLPEDFDMNAQEKTHGYTAMICCLYGQDDGGPDTIEALLERGADPNIQDLKGNAAIHHAAYNGQGDPLELLFRSKKTIINLENNLEGLIRNLKRKI